MEIARVFLDIPMYYGFQGLKGVLRKGGVNPETMDSKKFIVFINKAGTAFKVMVGPHFLVYHNNNGKKFPLEAIQHFPEFFDGEAFDFSAAASKVIKHKFNPEK